MPRLKSEQTLERTCHATSSISPRFYGIGRHISCVSEKVASFQNIIPVMYRANADTFSYQDLLIAGDPNFPLAEDEMYQELKWSCERKKSGAFVEKVDFQELLEDEENAFERSLTDPEKEILSDYRAMPQHPDLGMICMLNQKPSSGRGISSSTRTCYTLISNPSIHYLTKHKRWLLPSEMLILQGFPVTSALSCPGGPQVPACSFAAAPSLPARSRRNVQAQAGNAMQIPVIGSVLHYLLIFTRW